MRAIRWLMLFWKGFENKLNNFPLNQVCFSCRAFWRRAHKKTKNPNFTCSRGDTCVITVANRRKCKKCRFRSCQAAGMTESAILTEEQKKMRFRKMIQKREQMLLHMQNGVKEEEKSPQTQEIPYIQQMSVCRCHCCCSCRCCCCCCHCCGSCSCSFVCVVVISAIFVDHKVQLSWINQTQSYKTNI